MRIARILEKIESENSPKAELNYVDCAVLLSCLKLTSSVSWDHPFCSVHMYVMTCNGFFSAFLVEHGLAIMVCSMDMLVPERHVLLLISCMKILCPSFLKVDLQWKSLTWLVINGLLSLTHVHPHVSVSTLTTEDDADAVVLWFLIIIFFQILNGCCSFMDQREYENSVRP